MYTEEEMDDSNYVIWFDKLNRVDGYFCRVEDLPCAIL